jgi:hypothetical protein
MRVVENSAEESIWSKEVWRRLHKFYLSPVLIGVTK